MDIFIDIIVFVGLSAECIVLTTSFGYYNFELQFCKDIFWTEQ